MATLDETNIFGLPLKRQYGLEPKQQAPISEVEQASRQEYEQLVGSDNRLGLTFEGFLKAKERKKVSDQRKAVAQALVEGDTTKAYEGFTELPMLTDQLPAYMTPVLGNFIDDKERRYFAEKAGRQFKDPRDIELEMLMASDPRDVKQYTEQDPVAGAMSTLAGASSLIGIGEGPSLVKAGIMGMFPSLRKGMTAKTMDGQGGGSGGISEIPPEPKKDYAGFVSSVEKVALGPQKFGSGQDLINFIESPKRSGISQKELEYIDFDQIRNNPDLTKEDVIKYIQDNRPQIYRVQRVEDNPTYKGDADQNDLNELPYNEEASRMLNEENSDFYFDEYLGELDTQNSFILENETLKNNNYVLDEKTLVQYPDVKDALQNYLGNTSDAFYYLDEPIIRISYANGNVADFGINQVDDNEFFKQVIRTVDEDGAKVTFPLMEKNLEELAESASLARVSPDYGGQTEVYESVGQSGTNYQIVGNPDDGYNVIIDGESLDTHTDLADARGIIQSEAFDQGDILEGADTFDTGINAAQLLESAPFDVITGETTLPTRFGYQYDDYRLPMGGAENYREFTLHIANPKTPTRYNSTKGTKHFGGGDELLHYRTTDRIDEDGKKVLFVEEIQSDLHSTASSTKESQNYEIGPDTKKQAVKELRDIFKDNKNIRVADDGDIIKLDADSTYDTTQGLTAQEVANLTTFENLTDFTANIRTNKIGDLSDAEVKSLNKFREKYAKDEQVLPDYPYKGNDYIELAVKDIMKLASEGDYDRVAFTNAPTQINRNQKRLNFITDIGLQRVPSIEEYEKSNQFKADVDKNLETRFLDEKSLVESEFMNVFTNNYPNKEAWFADHPSVKNDIELVTKARWAEQNTEGDFILTKKGLGNLQNEDVYKSPEQLLEMIKQNPDKQVGAMPIRGKNIDDLLKELNMPLGDVKKQIMADIKAGNIPSSVDDGQIYELNIKEGSGKKYLDMYGKIIPQQLKKIAQKYDKNAKPQLKRVLYNENLEDVSPDILYEVYKGRLGGDDQKMLSEGLKTHESATIDITPEMRKAILTEGVNVMYKGGIVNKVKSMDKPIQGNRREI